jgi:hypothetical protein
MADDLETRRSAVAARLREARTALTLDWSASDREDAFLKGLKATLAATMDELQQQLATARDGETLDSIERLVRECAAKRAYWLEAAQVQTAADASIHEMQTWGIPERYVTTHLDPLQDTIRAALTEAGGASDPAKYIGALRRAQASLEEVFSDYQYWDCYTSLYVNRTLRPIVQALGIIGLLSLGAALGAAFFLHWNTAAVLLAGLGGTCVSILLKQEPLPVYGDLVKSLIWSAGRLLTGVIATVLGIGLLSSGFINVGFTADDSDKGRLVPLHALVRGCLDGDPCQPAQRGDAGARAGDGGAPDALLPDGGARPDAWADAGAAPGKPAAAPAPAVKCTPPACPTGPLFLLLGLAMMFGFSERAFAKLLAQFEDKLGSPPGQTPASPPSATPVPPAPSGQPGTAAPAPSAPPAEPPTPPPAPTSPSPPAPPAQPQDPAAPPRPPAQPSPEPKK